MIITSGFQCKVGKVSLWGPFNFLLLSPPMASPKGLPFSPCLQALLGCLKVHLLAPSLRPPFALSPWRNLLMFFSTPAHPVPEGLLELHWQMVLHCFWISGASRLLYPQEKVQRKTWGAGKREDNIPGVAQRGTSPFLVQYIRKQKKTKTKCPSLHPPNVPTGNASSV